jgi:DMSO/TMAO reductase YedYZ heme-binding membrane subunit
VLVLNKVLFFNPLKRVIYNMLGLIYNDLAQIISVFTKNKQATANMGGGINFIILIALVVKVLKYVIRFLGDSWSNDLNQLRN